jgi:hypothetical protein
MAVRPGRELKLLGLFVSGPSEEGGSDVKT